ncbi:MAG: AtpZ/AtpI family protein [Magnetococcus sp. WYHC-3]
MNAHPPLTPESGMGQALRMGSDLVAAVIVGGGIGYGLDRWLGSSPWMTLLFFLLGAVAGFRNLYRSASRMSGTPPGSGVP